MNTSHAYEWVRRLAAFLLICSATLKGHALITPRLPDLTLSAAWMVGVVAAEFALAGLLSSDRRKVPVRRLMIVVFTLFSLVAGWKALRGEESCGCFGHVQVDPRYTLSLDLFMVFLFCIAKPQTDSTAKWPKVDALVRLVCCAAALGLSAEVASAVGPHSALANQDFPTDSYAVLNPDSWSGKPFPLVKYINVGPALEKGSWIVVLHRDGCTTCQKALPLYEHLIQSGTPSITGVNLALIQMPPLTEGPPGAAQPNLVRGQLLPTRNWFATTPVVVLLRNGNVVASAYGNAAAQLDWLEKAIGTTRLNEPQLSSDRPPE